MYKSNLNPHGVKFEPIFRGLLAPPHRVLKPAYIHSREQLGTSLLNSMFSNIMSSLTSALVGNLHHRNCKRLYIK